MDSLEEKYLLLDYLLNHDPSVCTDFLLNQQIPVCLYTFSDVIHLNEENMEP